MQYGSYQILWMFLIYSFLGWTAETVFAASKKKKLLNRGFLNLPFSPIYGCGWILFAIFLPELKPMPFYLFLLGAILATGLELITGIVLEKLTGKKWWDYSENRFSFEGHICLTYSVLWGVAAMVCIYALDSLLWGILRMIPRTIGRVVLITAYILLSMDFLASLTAALRLRHRIKLPYGVQDRMQGMTRWLDNTLTRTVERRMCRAYPNLNTPVHKTEKEEKKRFAQGLCFYKLVCLFLIAAFLGDLIEMVFCRITGGVWMSRSSVVYGAFSIVWGLGAVLLTLILYRYRDRSDAFVFTLGAVLGGAYEYVCSVFTEIVFGTVFWDYSHMPFNLGGRINLLYCFFWGIAAVVWLKMVYPRISDLIEKLPMRIGKPAVWVMIVFMIGNIIISAMAMARYTERNTVSPDADSGIEAFLDAHFPDSRIQRIYPNLMIVDAE